MKILGIDPSTVATGWGHFTYHDGRFIAPRSGVLRGSHSDTRMGRLFSIYLGFVGVLDDLKPDIVCIEAAFVGRNMQTALALGQVSGALYVASRDRGIEVQYYSIQEIRHRVTDYGKSSKRQVARQVAELMGDADQVIPQDQADALAVAVCHAYRIEDLAVRA